MAWKTQKDGSIVIAGFEQGIAPSPYDGIADLKGVNVSSIKSEISLAYDRVRLDQAAVSGGSASGTGSHEWVIGSGTILTGTWIKILTVTGTTGLTVGNYYFVLTTNTGNTSFNLYSDFNTTQITADSGTNSFTFDTLNMGVPVDYVVESNGHSWRYYVLDQSGVIWVSGTKSAPNGTGFAGFSSSTIFSAITPWGSTTHVYNDTFTAGASICVMYSTDSNNAIQKTWMMVFSDSDISYFRLDTDSTWPSNAGATATQFQSAYPKYSNRPHKAILANDQVMYWTDGPSIGVLQQKTGQQFDPATSSTYNFVGANYLMAPNDSSTRISTLPSGSGISIIVGGVLNNLYIYPTYQQSTVSGAGPTNLLWVPEAYTQYFLQVNNYVLVFPGNKGDIYLTNGSSVVPILTVPDYIAGSESFVQDPYFIWGGAAYIRGRVFFSLKDQNANHTGNCGGVWSFVPTFSILPNQDSGLSLRMEGASSLYSTYGFDGYAPIIFAGQETTAQQANGPQYVAVWNQGANDGTNVTNSIDFSGTDPLTNSAALIETDAIPVGTFLQKRTFKQIEVKFSSALVSGETITVYYRTDLEGSWSSAGTIIYDTDKLAAITSELSFEKAQIIQLKVVLNGTATTPSWIRIKEIYIR